ncbi:hypothetical protein ENKNEFLB_00875 [Nocardioides aquaticus]|uniref:DUF4129 domain-containing protein n=1 Tax=Nocardioides aquaticus TaxID=160826 RepID=A0ABX8EIJ5_9ACTN|nr:hypothetical protein [Nocardioides aquaticus]QVT78498.1 hypothetical protein ENKNEFLB_00875 [Nocardioides aquaticus]
MDQDDPDDVIVRPDGPVRSRLRWFVDSGWGLVVLALGGSVLLALLVWLLVLLGWQVASAGVAGVGGALVALLAAGWRSRGRRLQRSYPEVHAAVRTLREALEAERRRLPHRRRSGASQESLEEALPLLEAAERDLARHAEPQAAQALARLTGLSAGWEQTSPEARRARALATAARAMDVRPGGPE